MKEKEEEFKKKIVVEEGKNSKDSKKLEGNDIKKILWDNSITLATYISIAKYYISKEDDLHKINTIFVEDLKKIRNTSIIAHSIKGIDLEEIANKCKQNDFSLDKIEEYFETKLEIKLEESPFKIINQILENKINKLYKNIVGNE